MTSRKVAKSNRDFKGVWIPKKYWLDENLRPMEMLFIVEIDSLDNGEGCFASNKHFANFFGVTPGRASQIITSLKEKGYIVIHNKYSGKQIIRREIRVVNKLNTPINKLNGGIKKIKGGYLENCEESNTYKSNTSNSNDDDDRTRAHGGNSAEKTFSLLNEYQLRQFKQGGHLTKLLSMVDEFGDDLVAWAIQQTVDSASSPNWNYFVRVIQRIQENNVHSVKEAVNLSKQHSEKLKHRGKVPRQPMESKPNDVPDWLKQGQNMTPEERAEWQAKALQEELAKGDNA